MKIVNNVKETVCIHAFEEDKKIWASVCPSSGEFHFKRNRVYLENAGGSSLVLTLGTIFVNPSWQDSQKSIHLDVCRPGDHGCQHFERGEISKIITWQFYTDRQHLIFYINTELFPRLDSKGGKTPLVSFFALEKFPEVEKIGNDEMYAYIIYEYESLELALKSTGTQFEQEDKITESEFTEACEKIFEKEEWDKDVLKVKIINFWKWLNRSGMESIDLNTSCEFQLKTGYVFIPIYKSKLRGYWEIQCKIHPGGKFTCSGPMRYLLLDSYRFHTRPSIILRRKEDHFMDIVTDGEKPFSIVDIDSRPEHDIEFPIVSWIPCAYEMWIFKQVDKKIEMLACTRYDEPGCQAFFSMNNKDYYRVENPGFKEIPNGIFVIGFSLSRDSFLETTIFGIATNCENNAFYKISRWVEYGKSENQQDVGADVAEEEFLLTSTMTAEYDYRYYMANLNFTTEDNNIPVTLSHCRMGETEGCGLYVASKREDLRTYHRVLLTPVETGITLSCSNYNLPMFLLKVDYPENLLRSVFGKTENTPGMWVDVMSDESRSYFPKYYFSLEGRSLYFHFEKKKYCLRNVIEASCKGGPCIP